MAAKKKKTVRRKTKAPPAKARQRAPTMTEAEVERQMQEMFGPLCRPQGARGMRAEVDWLRARVFEVSSELMRARAATERLDAIDKRLDMIEAWLQGQGVKK